MVFRGPLGVLGVLWGSRRGQGASMEGLGGSQGGSEGVLGWPWKTFFFFEVICSWSTEIVMSSVQGRFVKRLVVIGLSYLHCF